MAEQVAVVTGASQGLGLVIAQEFMTNGWQVVGTGRSAKPPELPETTEYHQFDAADPAASKTFWDGLVASYPEATYCLVNNAGGYIGGSVADSSPEDYAKMMQSCYFSSVYMTRELILHMPKARVINVISAGALAPHANNAAYGAAKAAEKHFFQALQAECAPDKYQITNLYPDNIASHGPSPRAIDAKELAAFICGQAALQASYYLPDVTLHARP